MTKPITPTEALNLAAPAPIPDYIIIIWNDAIVERMNGRTSVVLFDDVTKQIIHANTYMTSETVKRNGWLNVEELFREQGWLVLDCGESIIFTAPE